MCDIQIITGISILTGGFICLDENLSSHHWELIVYLAWFSSITHLSALTSLRGYLQAHPREKYVRVSLMFLLLMMLVTAMVPTAYFNWRMSLEDWTLGASAAYPSSPAACFFSIKCGRALYDEANAGALFTKRGPFIRSSAFQEMLLSLMLLMTSFISRAIKLSRRVSSILYRVVTHPIGTYLNYLSTRLNSSPAAAASGPPFIDPPCGPWVKIATIPSAAVIIAVQTQIILLSSMLIEVLKKTHLAHDALADISLLSNVGCWWSYFGEHQNSGARCLMNGPMNTTGLTKMTTSGSNAKEILLWLITRDGSLVKYFRSYCWLPR